MQVDGFDLQVMLAALIELNRQDVEFLEKHFKNDLDCNFAKGLNMHISQRQKLIDKYCKE